MGSLGPFEIALIFLAILLIFGAKRIPEIARGLGKGIREFKDATSDISKELSMDDKDRSPRIQQPRQGTTASRPDVYDTGHSAPEPPPVRETSAPDEAPAPRAAPEPNPEREPQA